MKNLTRSKKHYCLLFCLLLNALITNGQQDIFFSEYIEDGRNKCLELFNPTNATIDLSNYTIEVHINGSATPVGIPWNFSGRNIGPMAVIVLCQGLSDIALLSIRDYPFGFGNFNGNDAIVLKNNGQIIDIIGNVGCDPGTSWIGGSNKTEDVVLVRNACVDRGITNSGANCSTFTGLASDWRAYSKTDYSHLGNHDFGALEVEIFGESALCEQTEIILTATAGFRSYRWSNGSTTMETRITSPGTYTVTVTSAENCTATASKTINGQSPEIFAEIRNIRAVSCLPKADGGFTVVPSGGDGSGNFTYEWETGSSTSANISGVAAGEYNVTVMDNNGCSVVREVSIGGAASFAMTVTPNSETCIGRGDGSINISASGNGISYSIDGETFQNSGFFDNVLPGQYTVLATDNTGCGNQEQVTIDGGTRFDLRNSIVTQARCQGEGGGQIILVPNGGEAPYEVSFEGGPFTNQMVYTDLKGDTFDIVVRDASGCEKSFEQIIEEGSDLVVADVQTTPASCLGINDGVMNLTTTGGSRYVSINAKNEDGSYAFAQFIREFEGLAVGTYRYYAIDIMFRCEIPFDFEITADSSLLTEIITADPCSDDQKGMITVLAQTGNSPFQYSLDTGAFVSTNIFSDLDSNTYIVTTRDSLGCIKIDSVTVGAATNFEIESALPVAETCANNNDGQIIVTTSSINGVRYSLDDANYVDSPIFSGLAAGDYRIYAKSGNCMDSEMVTVLPATAISLVDVIPQMALCAGGDDGQLTINITGGNPPYAYKLDNGAFQMNNTFINLTQGTYTITVRDTNLCEQIFTAITLDEPTRLTADCVVTQQVSTKEGNDGVANVMVFGGTSPYTIQLINAGFNHIVTDTGLASFEELPAGNYRVEITDNNACTTSCNFTIEEPLCDFSIDNTQTDATCFEALDGTISLILPTENRPFTINWSDAQYNGQQQLTGLGMGNYRVTVSDQIGCTDSLMVMINQPPALSVEIMADNLTICEKDTAQLMLTETYAQYNWSNNAISASTRVDEAGTYRVTVNNADGCVATDEITINVITQDTIREARLTCDESSVGTFTLEERGTDGCKNIVFRTFELARKDTTFLTSTTCNPSEAGVVTNLYANVFGCDSLVILTTILLAADTTYQTEISCNIEEVGSRNVVLTNSVGCDSTLVIETNLDESFEQSFITEFTCNPIAVGVDTTFLKTFAGCDSLVITQTISNASPPTILTATTCITTEVGIDTSWLSNQFLCDSLVIINTTLLPSDFVPLMQQSCHPQDTGLVIQNLINQFGCDSIIETNTLLLPINECELSFSLTTDTICWGDNQGIIELNINEGIPPFEYYVLDNFGSDTIEQGVVLTTEEKTILTNIPVGQYSIRLINDRAISREASIEIIQANEIRIEGILSDYAGFAISCEGEADGSINLNLVGGQMPYTYLWSNGEQRDELQNLAKGNYQVTVTDADGCEQDAIFNLSSASELQIDFQSFSPRCFGEVAGRVTIYDLPNANGKVDYSLDGVLFQPIEAFPFTIENLTPNDYQLFVQDENDCQASAVFSIPMPNDNQLTLGDNQNLVLGDSLTLIPKANFEINRFEWSATVPLICENCLELQMIPIQSGQYTLTAYDANDCKVTASTAVNLRKESQVFLPNAFSPNEDGNNDVYQVLTGTIVKTLKSMRIFDYEGRLMYQVKNRPPNDVSVGWDGMFNGQKMQPAVFVVFVEVELLDGSSEKYQQTMTLVK